MKQYNIQDALKITGTDGEFEGCEDSSCEDPQDPDYTSSSKDMESDDLDSSESTDFDDVPQPPLEKETF